MATPPPKKLLTLEDIPGAPKWVEPLLGGINGALKPTAEALSQALTFRENFAGEVKTVTLTPPEDWEQVPFDANWANFGGSIQPFEHKKQADGTVKVRGSFKWTGGGSPAAGTRVSPLSDTLVTAARESFVVLTESPATTGALSVRPTGLFYEGGLSAAISTSGLEWGAADRTPPRWATPVDVRLGTPQKPFPGKPGAILVLSARPVADPTSACIVTGWDITPINLERQKSAPGIRIHRVWGLAPGVAYSLQLLVLPE